MALSILVALLRFVDRVLYSASNASPGRELLSNSTNLGKWSSKLLSGASNGSGF
jgi:hypothetical protein